MKKIFLTIVILIVGLMAVFVIYIKSNPPLSSPGFSGYVDKTLKVIEIENSGFVDIKINKVLVNGNEPRKVELGVSRSSLIVGGGAGLDENLYVSFHKINDFKIKPKLTPKEQKERFENGDLKSIKHYGLRVYGKEEPEEITVSYTYLGVPLKLIVNVR